MIVYFFSIFYSMKFITHLSIVLCIVVCSGCGPKTTDISGRITLDGQGLKDMGITMQPINAGLEGAESAAGITDEQGRFILKRVFSKKIGVEPGEYRVFINWIDPNPKPEGEPQDPCPYKLPNTIGSGVIIYRVEAKGPQTVEIELSDYPDAETGPEP